MTREQQIDGMRVRMLRKHRHLHWLVRWPWLRGPYMWIEWGLPTIGIMALSCFVWPMWWVYVWCGRRLDYLQNSLDGFHILFDEAEGAHTIEELARVSKQRSA